MHPLMKHVHRLSVQIGPRGSGTPREAEAADWLVQRFKAMGYQASVNTFRTVGSFSYVQMFFFGGILAAFGLSFVHPLLGVLLALPLLVLYVLDVETRFSIAPYFAKRASQNIRAWREDDATSHIRITGDEERLDSIVIMAHYDSSRAALNFHPKMVKGFRSSFFLVFASLAAITFFLVLRSIPALAPWETPLTWASVPFAAYLVIVLLMLAHRELFCQYTPGANDNASGVAVMLGVAARLAKHPLPGLNVEFVATGAEEAGTFGCLDYIKQYGLEGKTFINLDNLGQGQLFAAEAEGIIRRYPADSELLSQIQQVAQAKPALPIAIRPYRLLTTDATPILVRGGRAVSIMACAEDGSLPNWHWITDTSSHVEPQNLKLAEELVYRILQERGRVFHDTEATG